MSKIEVNTVEPQCGTTLTLGASGDTVTIPSGATLSASKVSGVQAVSWQTSSIKTATFTAAAGEGYFCNTSGGAFTVNLPAGSAGAIVAVSDYTRTFQTNNLTISPNGSEKIGGVAADATLSTEGQSATFVYVDSTEGWINVQETSNSVVGRSFITATGGTITTSGNCKIHTFTGPGTFCVSGISNCSANNRVSYLVVAGGGGGGGDVGGGGGAGGFRESQSPTTPYTTSPLVCAGAISVTATGFPITVGGGGAGGQYDAGASSRGVNGNNSIFSTITSTAGGGGGSHPQSCAASGNPGGSGGGGGARSNASGGSGNTPPVSPPQGKNGGNATPSPSPTVIDAGGGGGGATAAASNASNCTATAGGAGGTTHITGSPVAYAGGGGGGIDCGGGGSSGAPGGAGGGGAGGPKGNVGVAGTANTGGGGGGSSKGTPGTNGGTGGSGVVIIRYKFQ